MGFLSRDLRFAVRNLRKHPTFSAVAVVTIALVIGANTAIFSVVNGVLLQDLPYEAPDELVRIWSTNMERGVPLEFMSPPDKPPPHCTPGPAISTPSSNVYTPYIQVPGRSATSSEDAITTWMLGSISSVICTHHS